MSDLTIPHVTCTKCGELKPATSEYFALRSDGGYLRKTCRVCTNANRQQWKQEHPDKVRQSDRVYRLKHHEREAKRVREYAIKHPEKGLERDRRYRRNHPGITKVRWQARQAKKRNLPSCFTVGDWRRCLNYFNHRCAVCGRPAGLWHTLAQDHWIALSDSRLDNPGTVPTNIIPLCHGVDGCNEGKGSKDAGEWLVIRLGKRKANQVLKRIDAYFEWVKQQ